jgi:hypothetical protein
MIRLESVFSSFARVVFLASSLSYLPGNAIAASALACPIFGLPQLGHALSDVDCQPALALDTDGDGIKDWTDIVDGKRGGVLIPLDDDMDGDGIGNVFDLYPQANDDVSLRSKSSSNSARMLPKHLLFPGGVANRQDSDLRDLQQKLYQTWEIAAIQSGPSYEVWQLRVLIQVLTALFGEKQSSATSRLKYLYIQSTVNELGGAEAYFINSLRGMVLVSKTRNPTVFDREELFAAITHEIGHAVVFSRLSSLALQTLAERHGPWNGSFKVPRVGDSLLDRGLLTPHPDYNIPYSASLNRIGVPSRYALRNMHEWFAELFSRWSMSKLMKMGVVRNQSKAELSAAMEAMISHIMESPVD